MRLIFLFSATRFATQLSEMHLGSTEYEKWSIFNFLPKCQTGKWIKNTAAWFLNYLVTLVVRNMKAWPICCFLLLGGHNEKWMDQQYTDQDRLANIDFQVSISKYRFPDIDFRRSIREYRFLKFDFQRSISDNRFLGIAYLSIIN